MRKLISTIFTSAILFVTILFIPSSTALSQLPYPVVCLLTDIFLTSCVGFLNIPCYYPNKPNLSVAAGLNPWRSWRTSRTPCFKEPVLARRSSQITTISVEKLSPRFLWAVMLIFDYPIFNLSTNCSTVFWDPVARKKVMSRDVIFDEDHMLDKTKGEGNAVKKTVELELQKESQATNQDESHTEVQVSCDSVQAELVVE
ncbi:hypothetical protein AKJ16_DCAP16565 [Drosera capensis]